MSFLNFFGKKKVETQQSPLKVIQNMKETLELLEKREVFLEKKVYDLKVEAKVNVKINKNKALLLLKKAKMNEKQLLSIYGQKENLELQIGALEQGINNKNIIMSMKHGKNAIEHMTKTMDPDQIEELMDSISDGMAISTEIADAMSRPLGEVYDDDDLLAELEEELEDQNTINVVTKTVDTKTVDTKTVDKKELEELKELKELEALM